MKKADIQSRIKRGEVIELDPPAAEVKMNR